jgi:hypothetical protein
MSDENSQKFDQWGIVEVMGHKKFAGHITEQVIAGSALVRVDVPEVTVQRQRVEYDERGYGKGYVTETKTVGAFTKMVGVGSIYCITPTSEEIARKCATELAKYDSDPIPVTLPVERQLPASTEQPAEEAAVVVGGGDDDDDDDEGGDYPF